MDVLLAASINGNKEVWQRRPASRFMGACLAWDMGEKQWCSSGSSEAADNFLGQDRIGVVWRSAVLTVVG